MGRATAYEGKDIALEALRGVAAFQVVFVHARAAFRGTLDAGNSWPQIVNLPFAGGGAVMFFFVLSGYVLTRRYFDQADYNILIKGASKRYFRLAGPVLISCLLSAILFNIHAYHYREVGSATHSAWLFAFGYPGAGARILEFHPSILDAIRSGLFDVFISPARQYYNNVLWTMPIEFFGSLAAFLTAAILGLALRKSPIIWSATWIICLFASAVVSVFLAAFIAGVGISMVFSKVSFTASKFVTVELLVVAVLLLSFSDPVREYGFLAQYGFKPEWRRIVNLLGAVVLMVTVLSSPPLRGVLSGRIGAFLGRISFPIYLIHFLVLASAGCLIWTNLIILGPVIAFVGSFLATVFLSIVVSLPFAKFDLWWTSAVNRIVAGLLGSQRWRRRPAMEPAEAQSNV